MNSSVELKKISPWLAEHGPKELESLFRAIVFHPSSPILIADDERNYQEASVGAGKFFGLKREALIGRRVDDFTVPSIETALSERWQQFLKDGDQSGMLQFLGPDGSPREVEYRAKGNVLPIRHLLLLREKPSEQHADEPFGGGHGWAQDYALFLMDTDGCIVAWYSGAQRIYGYKDSEALGESLSLFYPRDAGTSAWVERTLKRAATDGHSAGESWHLKKDGSKFWANSITMALRDDDGKLQGYARVVRDFSDRHARDEKLERLRRRAKPIPTNSTVAGVVSGEFDRILEMNDRFLDIIGYRREDLEESRIVWADLTPKDFAAADEFAHEEGLRFGACSPFEKELIRQDGKRIRVLVATAVLKLTPFRWITFITDLSEREQQESVHSELPSSKQDFPEIIGTSRELKRALSQVELVAPTDATVLILGETGTGKELIAHALHRLSPRRNGPFVSVNCAAIPTGLLESELFGYEKGAFTGALQQKIGRFEMANNGTLFLDEVGDIPFDLQPKLLRALQEKCFERLGSTRTTPINIRLVAATNRNLVQMVGDNLFRSDLYYRLKVFPINLPPLRDRPEDIALLVRHFVKKYAAKMNRKVDKISSETMRALMNWSWPGNIRELENFMEKSVILSMGATLNAPISELRTDPAVSVGSAMEDVEREHILRILRETNGSVSAAAIRLRLPRTTLNAMMKRLGISRKDL